MSNIVIFGANSAIATAFARQYAPESNNFYLLSRNQENLNLLKDDLTARGAKEVFTQEFDALDSFDNHQQLIQQIHKTLGSIDIALFAYGSLPDQEACFNNSELAIKEINLNGVSVVSLVNNLSQTMIEQKSGHIAVISSVAGDRGRPSNFVYGSAKKLVSTYIEGSRAVLAKHNTDITDIKPGFVDTPMTDGFDKSGFLWSNPEVIAKDIKQAINKKKCTVYSPFYWRYIMLIIKHIPGFIFKKLNF